MNKRRIVTLVIVVAVLAALVAGWALSQRAGRAGITTATVQARDLKVGAAASGRLTAPLAASVSAPSAGTLATVPVADGQHVEAGQVLATLDAGPLDLAVTQAEAQLAAARAMPTGTQRLTNARAAAIRSAEASLRAARDSRGRAQVTAPVAGTVQFTSLSLVPGTPPLFQTHAGASVTAGMPLFTIVDLTQLRFEAQVDESDVAGVQPGQRCTVTLDSYPGRPFSGTVESVRTASVTTSTGGTAFPVACTVDAAGARLFVGMTGDATVDTETITGALVVPAQAVVAEGGEHHVWRIEGDTARRTRVIVGATTDTLAQITSGLSAGDVVATGNVTGLADGASVDVRS